MTKSKIYDYTKEELQEIFDNSISLTDVLRKIGIKGGSSINTLKRVMLEYDISEECLKQNNRKMKSEAAIESNKNRKTDISEYLHKGTTIASHRLKIKLIENNIKECKCEICGIKEWLGKPIKLHLHHKDGDHSNNELENLELLCPNCHSYTDNYGVYNSSTYKEKISNK